MKNHSISGFSEEGYLTSSDGLQLHYLSRKVEQPRYQIIGIHGLGEHAGRYAWFADQLANTGACCSFMELRGHGLSEGPRGHSPSYAQLISDIDLFVEKQRLKNIPIFFFGHSLGGGLALNYALKLSLEKSQLKKFAGFISLSPLLKLSFQPPAWKLFLAKLLVKTWPKFSLDRGVNSDLLTRDKTRADSYRADPLNHELVSASMTLGFLAAGQHALNQASELDIATLLLHGEKDQVTDITASRQFAQSAGDILTFKSFEDCYHELINEINREEVFSTIQNWIQQQIGERPSD